ncbi:hexosaminidase [Chitinophaga sp. CF118]|uniref:family 20 glycosylhydrolase n=1 Tax=Chitinophaga sp. CF118 TaxID=1884367 RepID=UPI0008EF067A|nr:family 20 glycosylhydrolase [Chitinophaga sp. CF118]SFE13572.1 hexosaminidase [Chitinophaga sp. CF118]
MKKLLLSALAMLYCFWGMAQLKTGDITIIPEPEYLKPLPGSFVLNDHTLIHYTGQAGKTTADLLQAFLKANYNIELQISNAPLPKMPQQPVINFVDVSGNNPETNSMIYPERYELDVNAGTVSLKGDAAGLFYGLQTLQQLLPLEKSTTIHIPGVQIIDKPRFAYRGLMLDVSRHFFPPSYIKQFIDVMAQYKFNRFHWHLTDDQGWRIEIKKYPRLQEIASQRKETIVGHHRYSNGFDGKPYGGYYTQDEVRDIVKYAAERHITIIPEIEMPGHSQAVLTAYPSFGNTGGPYEVRSTWGISKDILNPVNDSVFTFLEDVLIEVMDLFPAKYIHIGGDECLKDRWKESPQVQELIKKLGLKDEHALQSYFIQRIEKFVNSKGRNIIGWDEILEGGLAPNATVMSWRGEEGGIAAAKEKHDVIMTPNTYLYLDYYQGHPATEPLNAGGYLPLSTIYKYEPLPPSLNAEEQKYIKGVQANIWTEFIPDNLMADYMVWPRALALSETAWSPASKKNYNRFLKKMPAELARMEKENINFRIPEPAGLESKLVIAPAAIVKLTPPVKGAAIYYTTDGNQPGINSNRYTQPIHLQVPANGSVKLQCIVVTPSGRKSPLYSATYINSVYQPAADIKPEKEGIHFSLNNNITLSQTKQIPAKADSTGIISGIQIRTFLDQGKTNYSVTWEGYVKIDTDGLYEFHVNADDGAVLYIDDKPLVDNDGTHTLTDKTAFSALRKGFHKIKVQYFNAGGNMWLDVFMFKNGEKIDLNKYLFTNIDVH